MQLQHRIGIIVLKEKYITGRELIVLMDSLRSCTDNLMIYCADLSKIIFINEKVKNVVLNMEILKNKSDLLKKIFHYSVDEEVIFCDNSFFGPFKCWESYLEDAGEANFWGLEERAAHLNKYDKWEKSYIQPCFLKTKISVLKTEALINYINSYGFELNKKFTKVINELEFTQDTYLKYQNIQNPYMEDEGKICPYTIMKKYNFPILRKDAFVSSRLENLEFHSDNEIKKAIEYIRNNSDYDCDVIYEYIIRNYSPWEVRNLLNASYILDTEKESMINESIYSQTVIAVHMYYMDKFKECLEYLKCIPEQIDIYITVCSLEAKELLEDMIGEQIFQYHIIVSQNVGRDWGAFILDLWKYVKDYKYICFLHDKKTTDGKGYAIVGNYFMDMTWESLIYSEEYIKQVLDLFEKENKLGLLSPNIPYHSSYFQVLGDAWTVCYETTLKLAEQIGIRTEIDSETPPFALSSMFWFRKSALQKLFEYPFMKRDFPMEPLSSDGTLNHALERIVIYVAKEQGFYSGTVQERTMAENNLVVYGDMLRNIVKNSFDTFGSLISEEIFSVQYYKKVIELIKFVLMQNKVYIYGAGNNGKQLAKFFKFQELKFNGFIVSRGYKVQKSLEEYPIYELNEIENSAGIVVAVNKTYLKDILKNLQRGNYENIYIFTI